MRSHRRNAGTSRGCSVLYCNPHDASCRIHSIEKERATLLLSVDNHTFRPAGCAGETHAGLLPDQAPAVLILEARPLT